MEHISKHLSESRYKKVLDAKYKAKRAEKREFIALCVFGLLAISYFVGHYIVYLVNN